MCGLFALITSNPIDSSQVLPSTDRMACRGPDSEGIWQSNGVILTHRRLAIQDLDDRSSQPMVSQCGRYAIVFNGEIYNYQELRKGLCALGVNFRTTSDTEVILALFSIEGEAMLPKLQGMFAFVIWDNLSERAFIARDPYGIKPLYLATIPGGFVLASQVKALIACELVSQELDSIAQAGFWMLGSVPEPYTWFKSIKSVRAGHSFWIEKLEVRRERCWFDIGKAWIGQQLLADVKTSRDIVQSRVSHALRESLKRHIVSDVPIGVFLSGGIDSGAIAGLMSELELSNIEGVTIAFNEYKGLACDEVPAASLIASHYNLRHHVRIINEEEFSQDLPRIINAMDQPSIDGINTWYANKAIAELGLKVAVSGVGGDELFLGYTYYHKLSRFVEMWSNLSRVPGLRRCGEYFSKLQSARTKNARWKYAAAWLQTTVGGWWLQRSSLAPEGVPAIIRGQTTSFMDTFSPEDWVEEIVGTVSSNRVLALAQLDSQLYLRNQLLRDSDWASMDHSVELRTPLVDATLLTQIAPLLPEFHRFPGKSLLANAPKKKLPPEIQNRRKTGFLIPTKKWIQSIIGESQTWQQFVAEECYS